MNQMITPPIDDLASARRALQEVLDEHSDLGVIGFFPDDTRRARDQWTPEKKSRSRELMFEECRLLEFAFCRTWLNQLTPLKRINRSAGSSYGWKHRAEECYDRHYVSNGMFIAAAIANGLRFVRSAPNAYFNLPCYRRPQLRNGLHLARTVY